MSLWKISALIECDRCGKRFVVFLDAASATPPGKTLFDLVVNEISAGDSNEPATVSMAGIDMLCAACTKEENS